MTSMFPAQLVIRAAGTPRRALTLTLTLTLIPTPTLTLTLTVLLRQGIGPIDID